MLGPLGNKPFRRLLSGRVITNVGDSLYFVAAMWLVYELTGDPFYTGLAGFLTLLPSAFQFLAGPLVDKWSIRRTLVGTQLVQALIVLVVPLAEYTGTLNLWLILTVMPILSLCNQLVYPAQTAALPRILDDEELVEANSAFSIAYQGVDIVANGASGIFIALVGAVTLFAVDAVTFGIAALLFATVTVPSATQDEPATEGTDSGKSVASDGGTPESEDEQSYLEDLREGFRFLQGTFIIRLLVGISLLNFLAGFALASLPVYAEQVSVPAQLSIVAGAGAYGVLMAGFSAGNFFGSISASFVDDRPFGWTVIVGCVLSAMAAIAAVAINWLPATAALLLLAFLPFGIINVQLAAVVQSAPPDEYVGRVSSVLGSASSVSVPIGSLAGGVAGSVFGPRLAMYTLGIGALALGAYVLVLPSLRTLSAVDQISLDA